jgi:hypothetical protein
VVNYCLSLSFLPGGIELAKKFTTENSHTKEHDEFYKITGITREHIWIQRSPLGSVMPDMQIVSIETSDPANTLKEFAISDHPWAIKFRKYAKEAFGIDFSSPPPPLNENIVDWNEKILEH